MSDTVVWLIVASMFVVVVHEHVGIICTTEHYPTEPWLWRVADVCDGSVDSRSLSPAVLDKQLVWVSRQARGEVGKVAPIPGGGPAGGYRKAR